MVVPKNTFGIGVVRARRARPRGRRRARTRAAEPLFDADLERVLPLGRQRGRRRRRQSSSSCQRTATARGRRATTTAADARAAAAGRSGCTDAAQRRRADRPAAKAAPTPRAPPRRRHAAAGCGRSAGPASSVRPPAIRTRSCTYADRLRARHVGPRTRTAAPSVKRQRRLAQSRPPRPSSSSVTAKVKSSSHGAGARPRAPAFKVWRPRSTVRLRDDPEAVVPPVGFGEQRRAPPACRSRSASMRR